METINDSLGNLDLAEESNSSNSHDLSSSNLQWIRRQTHHKQDDFDFINNLLKFDPYVEAT